MNQLAVEFTGWAQQYEQLARGKFTGSLDEIWLGETQLVRERTTLDMFQSGSAWGGALVIAVPLSLRGQAVFAGQPVTSTNVMAHGAQEGYDVRLPSGLDIVSIATPASMFREYAETQFDLDPEVFITGLRRWSAPTDVLDRVRRFLRELYWLADSDELNLADANLRRSVELDVHRQLITIVEHLVPTPKMDFTTSVRRTIVQKAQEYVLSKSESPPTIDDVCVALRISRRHLQTCFQEMLGMSPHQYMITVRLNGMRRDLLAGRGQAEVQIQDVAARWGFWHMSHCATAYRRLFGERPSDTLGSPARQGFRKTV